MKDDVFNLELLQFFVALVNSESLIKTGKSFGYSEAGSSRALEKLRRGFNHQLFKTTPKGLIATAYARSLVPRVLETIEHLKFLIGNGEFDPLTCTRTFHLAARGFLIGKILRDIMPVFHAQAPSANLEVHPRTAFFAKELEERIIDLAWVTEQLVQPDMHYLYINEVKPSLICAKNHPLVAKCNYRGFGPSDEEIAKYPLVVITLGHMGHDGSPMASAELQKFPRLLNVADLSFALPLITSSDYLCFSPEASAIFAMENYDVTFLGLENSSLKGEVQKGLLVWNDLTHKDPAMIWFRNLFRNGIRNINSGETQVLREQIGYSDWLCFGNGLMKFSYFHLFLSFNRKNRKF